MYVCICVSFSVSFIIDLLLNFSALGSISYVHVCQTACFSNFVLLQIGILSDRTMF